MGFFLSLCVYLGRTEVYASGDRTDVDLVAFVLGGMEEETRELRR